ncbi:MAG: prepilin-type N-terminal cleavage/methylation domain-containing protein [Candidatus Omnitrophica bacterium]|nr:prepilin-type N-terminal cleavage/methylation domain-containing protein [Candidatus Omnitrophota bacterium]
MTPRPRHAGFTMTELLVVLALFGIVSAALVTLLLSAQRSWTTGSGQAVLTAELRRGLDRISRELVGSAAGRVQRPPVNGAWDTQMTFQIPQDRNGDGAVLDAAGAIVEWSDLINYQRGARNSCLRRVGAGAALQSETVANHITDLRFRQILDAQTQQPVGIIEIQMTASTITEAGDVMSRTMATRVKVRN